MKAILKQVDGKGRSFTSWLPRGNLASVSIGGENQIDREGFHCSTFHDDIQDQLLLHCINVQLL